MTNLFQGHESDLAVIADLARPDVLKFGDNGVAYNGNIKLDVSDRYLNGRTRQYGKFVTDSLKSFSEFVRVHGTPSHTKIFLDRKNMVCEAVLNFGDDNYAMGHCDFRAVLSSNRTKVFDKMVEMHWRGRIEQKEFATFLEDWGSEIVAYDENGIEIPMKKATAIVRDMKIDEMVETASQVGNFRESRSRLETVAVKSQAGLLPAYFELNDNLYQTLRAIKTVKMRLAIATTNGKPKFTLSVVGYELLSDELANDFLDVVKEELGGEHPLFFGDFRA